MFNSEEITKRALLRAEEIKTVKKKKRNFIQAAAITLSLCAALVVISLLVFPLQGDLLEIIGPFTIPLSAPLIPDENAKPYMGREIDYPDTFAENKFIIQSYDKIIIPANALDVQVFLVNPDSNRCFFVFKIILEETEEIIYVSGLVKPGMYLENITLLKALEKGEYNAVLEIHTYDLERYDFTQKSEITFNLIVK